MARFRCKPVEVDAIQLRQAFFDVDDGIAEDWVAAAIRDKLVVRETIPHVHVKVRTLEGWVATRLDSWLVRGALGELWPVQNRQFDHKYDPVEEST